MSKRVDFLIATGLTGLVLVGAVALAMPDPKPSGWGGAGSVQSISIHLGTGQAETGKDNVDEQSADSVESRAAEQPVEDAPPEPNPEPDSEPVIEPDRLTAPVVEPEPEPEPELEPEPEPVSEPEVVEAELKPDPEPEPELEVRPHLAGIRPAPMKPQPPARPKSTENTTPAPKPASRQPQAEAVSQPVAGPVDSSWSEGRVGDVGKSQAASSSQGRGGGAASRAAMADYKSSVVQMLMRFREYPDRAKRRRIEGRNRIRVVIERDGSIRVFEMVGSSGAEILDRSTRKLIERVKRFPPFPDDMVEQSLTLTIPVIYDLR